VSKKKQNKKQTEVDILPVTGLNVLIYLANHDHQNFTLGQRLRP